MPNAYLTYFDINYAVKGLAMIRSLLRQDPGSTVRVLCLDDEVLDLLAKLSIDGLIPARLSTIEAGDEDLASARSNRSRVEYYWTLTPTVLLHFLEGMEPDEILTYVDADMLFFSSTEPVFREMEGKSVLIHKHNFPPAYASFAANGEYNVGLVAFRNDREGIRVLDWWRERCNEWCYDRCENGKMGDQKYLEHFSSLSDKVAIAQNPGIGVAPWNFTGYRLGERERIPTVDGRDTVFYHYHSTAYLGPGCVAPCADLHYPCTTAQLRLFMIPYLEALDSALGEIVAIRPGFHAGFKVSGLNTGMCLLGKKEQTEAFRRDYPCIINVEGDFFACVSPQYPEGEKVCGPVIRAGELSWVGDYPDWESAEKAAGGYDDHSIFAKVRDAAGAVRDGKALWERDSALFQVEKWNWPLLASLFEVAAKNGGELHVLDFGGAFGSVYMQHRRALGALKECVWNVVEQKHFVEAGQREFSNHNLRFHVSAEEALKEDNINVILLSSVLQYLPAAWALLRKLLKTGLPIILDRAPMLPDKDRITVQYVPESIYKASYPCRWMSKKRLEWMFDKAGYALSPWWQSDVDPVNFLGVAAFPREDAKKMNVEVGGRLRVMQVDDFYPGYLDKFYENHPGIGGKSSLEQAEALLKDGFSAIHTIAPYLDQDKFETSWLVAQALPLQRAWAMENGLPFPSGKPDWQREMVRQRIEEFRPDALYLGDPDVYDAKFIAGLKHRPKLILGWKAADMWFDTDLHGYDIILSGLPKLLEFALARGAKKGLLFKPGMPQWLADAVAGAPKTVDVCFAGSISAMQHGRRLEMLDAIAQAAGKNGFSLNLHLNCKPALVTTAMRPFTRPPVFGLAMHKALASAKIVVDDRANHGVLMPDGRKRIDLGGEDTINMRLFEATGSGSLLLTENIRGVNKYFVPGKEIDTWNNHQDLVDKILYWLDNPEKLEDTARAGKLRCLNDHGMEKAKQGFAEIITREFK